MSPNRIVAIVRVSGALGAGLFSALPPDKDLGGARLSTTRGPDSQTRPSHAVQIQICFDPKFRRFVS